MPFNVPDANEAATAAVEARTPLRRRRKRDMIFEAPLAESITLWASVAITRGQAGEETAADLWVGVRHAEVERLVAEASGRPPSIAGTVIHPVFVLVADARTYVWWPVREAHVEDDAAQLADDLADPGLAWAARLSSLEALVDELRRAYRRDLAWWRLPAALLLLDRADEAEAYVAEAAEAQARSGMGQPGDLERYWAALRDVEPRR